MTARIDPGLEPGDEVILVHQPVRAPRESVEGTLGVVLADGRATGLVVSGDGWAVHVDPVNLLSLRRA